METIDRKVFWVYYALILLSTIIGSFVEPSFATISMGLSMAFLGFTVQFLEKNVLSAFERNLKALPQIETLHEEHFYNTFTLLINNAQKNVDISHMSLTPPVPRRGSIQKSYYDNLSKVIKKSPAAFQRVERISKAKIPWIEKLIGDFQGVSNFSLYCYLDKTPEDRKKTMSDLLSIQRVDDQHLFIVALKEHQSTKGTRDIYIRSAELREYFSDYFQSRVVNKCQPIIENGVVNTENWKYLKGQLK